MAFCTISSHPHVWGVSIESQDPNSKKIKLLGAYVVINGTIVALFFALWIHCLIPDLGNSNLIGDNLTGSVTNCDLITFSTNVVTVNLEQLTLSLLWYPEDYGPCNNDTCRASAGDIVEIFLDPTLLAGPTATNSSNLNPGDPAFLLDVVSFCDFRKAAPLYWNDLPVFQSDLRLMPWIINMQAPPDSDNDVFTSTAINYPFDECVCIFFDTLNKVDSPRYHALVNVSARQANSIGSLRTQLVIGPLIPGFEVGTQKLSAESDPNYVRSITLKRSFPLKVYVVLVSVCIALVAVILFVISLDFWLWGKKHPNEVLVLPIATTFAFTQLRQALPAVPTTTGIRLDYDVNLACFGLLAVSTILSTFAIIFGSKGDRRGWTLYRLLGKIQNEQPLS
ncbi:hypothetical protein FB45DRAFT_1051561 [Roridomyces roridus]|uniref:Transmembrane protein n=1 Tax=Roridomyces roridus TaxID=1738132 RepID=A0AAD7FYY2_9AGAR|nr:hypothetical protein FB45DRAFT_1051561 [Roridomyces roridus]